MFRQFVRYVSKYGSDLFSLLLSKVWGKKQPNGRVRSLMEFLMKPTTLALAAALALAPATGFAHGQVPQPAHGGQVQDAHGSWVELVLNGKQVAVYVTDDHGASIPSSQVSGTAAVLVGGQIHKVQLMPAEGNELTGKLPVAVSGQTVATVSLKIGGKRATARFASAL